jgi:hypothetical protein
MRFRAFVSLLLALLLSSLGACSQSPGISTPVTPEAVSTQPVHSPCADGLQSGHNLLGLWSIRIDPVTGAAESVPVRVADLHLNVLSFLEFGPCTDCLKITDLQVLPNKNVQIEITLTHPFSLPNLSGFDVRGIAMFNGSMDFPALGVAASSSLEGDTELLNADGHTTLYNPTTAGNGFRGYLKGRMAPGHSTPDATLNGFKTYFSNSNRRYFLAGNSLSATFLLSPLSSPFTFGYAVDASWDKPTKPTTVPDSFPITANSAEAYLVETALSNALATNPDSTATLTVDVYDWQGQSTIGEVHVEGPYLWDGLIEALETPGGPGTQRFTCQLVNEYGAVSQGNYPVLIQVLDTSSQPGELVDNIAWRMISVPVIVNHAPTCSAVVSDLDPDPGELVAFTDDSTDPEGPEDLSESWWDWDNDGTWDEQGFEVTHSWLAPGIYEVNHMVKDKPGATDQLDSPLVLDVGIFITLLEDYTSKAVGTNYRHESLDHTYDSGALINVEDADGPWDFTSIGLSLGPNWMRILGRDDPEVAGFVNDFNANTTHFVKYESMFDPIFPVLYQAEYHHFATNKLFIYGFHDPLVVGSCPFGPPDTAESLAIPYPLTTTTNYSFDIVKAGFVLNYSVRTIGEGDVTIPYNGGTIVRCLLVRYRFTVSSAEPFNGGTLNFAFVTDEGEVVANVIAVNDPPIYNWNQSTNRINGTALFQALHDV